MEDDLHLLPAFVWLGMAEIKDARKSRLGEHDIPLHKVAVEHPSSMYIYQRSYQGFSEEKTNG